MHMLRTDGTELPAPDPNDPHGWTVLYKTPACDHVHRVLGWTGTRQRASLVCLTSAAMLHPYLAALPIPAPIADMPGEACGVITECPPEIMERVHRGEKVSSQEMAEAGVVWADMVDEVLPPPIMAAHRLVELLEGKGVDVLELLYEARNAHGGQHALFHAATEAGVMEQLMSEFPVEDDD